MKKLFVALMVGVSAAALSGQAQNQNPPDQQTPTFRTGVDLLSVDVGVVDPRGNPVDDLRAADFTVKIDGEQRRVVSAELVKIDVAAARKQVEDKSETFYTSNLTPPNGRQIVIAVDQVSIRPGTVRTLMATAQKFVDKLSPLDQVAFIAYPEPGPRVSFTSDRLKIKLAMQRLIGHEADPATGRLNIGVTEAIAIYERRDQIVQGDVERRECANIRNPDMKETCLREVQQEAAIIAQRAHENADRSLRGLTDLLRQLQVVDGNKALILISEGITDDTKNDLEGIAALAGRARVSMNILIVDESRSDAGIGERPPSDFEDRRLQVLGLQGVAFASRGAVFHVAGTGEGIFDRLLSEISAFYVLGVEQRPSDSQGDRHRIDVNVGRRGVTIRSRQAFVLSGPARAKASGEDNLRNALISPFPVTELPLRVTTFAQQDAASAGKVRLTIAAEVGQPGAAPAPFTLGYLVVNEENKMAASFGEKISLAPASGLPTEPLQFVSSAVVEPGVYTLRLAAVDAEGRRGSVIRDVSAWKMDGEELALGDLIVGNLPEAGKGLTPGVEPHVTTDRLAAYVELYSTAAATFDSTVVNFEVADDADSAALATLPAQFLPGRQPTWRVAQGLLGASVLPPGRYVARAKITRSGKTIGILSRPFVLERGTNSGAIISSVIAPSNFVASLPKFDKAAVLGPELVGAMLDTVEKRSSSLKDAMIEARAGRYGPAALEALGAGDQTAAAFMRGLDLFVKGQLNEAATQLQVAQGPKRDFFPASFYLGAVFAAAGRDRDAAGVWQSTMGTEARPGQLYAMVADARLREGQTQSAVDILKPVYEKNPQDIEVGRRLGMAYVMVGRFAEAIPVLDNVIAKRANDPELLVAAIVASYEVARSGQVLSNVDREKLRKYSAAYRGPQEALVSKYLTVINGR